MATTTNWGCYGLITAISKVLNKEIIKIKEEKILKKIISLGGVDGLTKKKELTYDTFTLKQSSKMINILNAFLE